MGRAVALGLNIKADQENDYCGADCAFLDAGHCLLFSQSLGVAKPDNNPLWDGDPPYHRDDRCIQATELV